MNVLVRVHVASKVSYVHDLYWSYIVYNKHVLLCKLMRTDIISKPHPPIQSNKEQTPGQFDRDFVCGQIQQLAVFETVDLVQTGEYI